jgi:ABC-2 type transport system permease protein
MRKRRKMLYGLWPIFKKEVLYILRSNTVSYYLVFQLIQLILIGYAVNTNVRQIRTVVYDLAHTQESRQLIQRFINTDGFKIVRMVYSDKDLYDAIVSGEARVSIKIPANYSSKLLDQTTANILVLVDGSNSTVTSHAVSIANGLMLRESLGRLLDSSGSSYGQIPVEARHNVLFNPDSRTPNFTIPGLLAMVIQSSIVYLAAASIVRERERGTLEQLSLTPITPLCIMAGKMIPYWCFGFLQQSELLLLSYLFLGVPIHGSYLSLMLFTSLFLLAIIGVGLVISVRSKTLGEAGRKASNLNLLTLFLSGYLFEIDSMPRFFQWVSKIIPATYYVDTVRGIMLRGTSLRQLWPNALVMLAVGAVTILFSANQFQKRNRIN